MNVFVKPYLCLFFTPPLCPIKLCFDIILHLIIKRNIMYDRESKSLPLLAKMEIFILIVLHDISFNIQMGL